MYILDIQNKPPPGGLEPPTFRLTAERANQLRHGGLYTSWHSYIYEVLQEKFTQVYKLM